MRHTLERIDPGNITEELHHDETLKLHVERYQYAGKFLKPGNVIDVACGTGYGSYFLATRFGEKITQITAVDNHLPSIQSAHARFHHPKIEFVHHNATAFHPSIAFDNIVSLETIEHLPNPGQFTVHFANLLNTGGRFIASVPITPSTDANPYHFHDFTIRTFESMFESAGLKKVASRIQRQPFNPLKILSGKEKGIAPVRQNLGSYYLKHPRKLLLRIRSTLIDGFVNKYLLVVFEKV